MHREVEGSSPSVSTIYARNVISLGNYQTMHFDLKRFLDILQLVGPGVLAAAGVPPEITPVVIHGIALAESKPVSGAEKKALVVDTVATATQAVNIFKPGTVPEATADVVSQGIDATVAAVNLFKPKPAA